MANSSGIMNFSMDDLKINEDHDLTNTTLEGYKIYDSNKNSIVFNKLISATEMEIQIHKTVCLSECVPVINESLKWLNSNDCKNELINNFCEFVNNYSNIPITTEEIIQNKWYEELKIQSAIINIPIDYKKIYFCIICVDNWHILYIEIEENKIISVIDEYVDPENGVGYNGIWTKT